MTIRPLSRAEVRAIDREAADRYGLPTLVLMENAGRGAADRLLAEPEGPRPGGPPVLILAGPGNNGGDAAVVARWLDLAGIAVRLVWLAEPGRLAGDAAVQRAVVEASGLPAEFRPGPLDRDRLDADLAACCWAVDGLLGTGLDRPVQGPLRDAIEAINASGRPVLALDLPSGLDADSGAPLGPAVRATLTATFVAPKLGFARPGADAWTGRVAVVPIGAPRRLLQAFAAPGPDAPERP